jgi:hypothetical protein
MTKQIRVTKDKAVYRDNCETSVLFNGSSYTLISMAFYPVIVITNFSQMVGFESIEEISIPENQIKTIAI